MTKINTRCNSKKQTNTSTYAKHAVVHCSPFNVAHYLAALHSPNLDLPLKELGKKNSSVAFMVN